MRVFPEYDGPMFTWPRVEALPFAREVLAALYNQWTLAVATNAAASDERGIWAALDRAGLSQWLDKVYCFRAIGHRKPAPAFFDYVLKDLGLAPARVMMVGDDFEADVLGASRCGMRAFWFNERSNEVREGELYRTIHDLRALPQALETPWAKTDV
jgi:putative hydrolase of the HAD superfamily